MFNPQDWASMPWSFWAAVFFVFGCLVGSLLNVCIHRMPLGQSIVSPGSHCPHCEYSIPWYFNIPLVTWLYLRGKCANCKAPISIRYFMVELLTGLLFLASWLAYGRQSPLLTIVYCLFVAGLIVASFIDIEHFIIPDEITLGGTVAGFLCSAAVPMLHSATGPAAGLKASFIGIAVGAGLIYMILRLGKLMFGRQRFDLEPGTGVIFTEEAMVLPDQTIPYEEMFYRETDAILLKAETVELIDRGYWNVPVRLTPRMLRVGEDEFNPEEIVWLEVVTNEIVIPREAMGLGDVKFMAAIGAFLGWQAVVFSLMTSAIIGSVIGVTLILFKQHAWSSRLPYGPYIALAALVWIMGGNQFAAWWLAR